jgi:hypothetical protein
MLVNAKRVLRWKLLLCYRQLRAETAKRALNEASFCAIKCFGGLAKRGAAHFWAKIENFTV